MIIIEFNNLKNLNTSLQVGDAVYARGTLTQVGANDPQAGSHNVQLSSYVPTGQNHFVGILRKIENLGNNQYELHVDDDPTKFPFKQGYKLHTHLILPIIGKLFSKDKVAYSYLSESANYFPFGEKFNNILKKNGFTNSEDKPVTFGVATIYTASK